MESSKGGRIYLDASEYALLKGRTKVIKKVKNYLLALDAPTRVIKA